MIDTDLPYLQASSGCARPWHNLLLQGWDLTDDNFFPPNYAPLTTSVSTTSPFHPHYHCPKHLHPHTITSPADCSVHFCLGRSTSQPAPMHINISTSELNMATPTFSINLSKFGSGLKERFETSFFLHVGHSLLL